MGFFNFDHTVSARWWCFRKVCIKGSMAHNTQMGNSFLVFVGEEVPIHFIDYLIFAQSNIIAICVNHILWSGMLSHECLIPFDLDFLGLLNRRGLATIPM
jgi:hypothetical protein